MRGASPTTGCGASIECGPEIGQNRRVEYDIDFDPESPFDVVVTTSGAFDPIDTAQFRERVLTDPRFLPGMNVLLDHTRLEFSDTRSIDVRQIAESAARRFPDSGLGRIAFVVPRGVGYGLFRMYQSLTSAELADRSIVVESVEEANVWLRGRLSSSG